MKIELPFVYSTTFSKGNGTRTTTTASDTVTADVPEIGRRELAEAVMWRFNNAVQKVFTWNGDLYMNASHPEDELLRKAALADITKMVENRHISSTEKLYGSPHWSGVTGKVLKNAFLGVRRPLKTPNGATAFTSTFEADRLTAQHRADGVLLVDDVVFHRVPGILLHLRETPRPELRNLDIGTAPYGYTIDNILHGVLGIQNPSAALMFGVDELDLDTETFGPLNPSFDSLEIYDPDAVKMDGRSEFIGRLLVFAYRASEYRLGDMDTEEVGLWLRTRDAAADWYSLPPAPPDEDAVEVLSRFTERSRNFGYADRLLKGCQMLCSYPAKATTVIRGVSP